MASPASLLRFSGRAMTLIASLSCALPGVRLALAQPPAAEAPTIIRSTGAIRFMDTGHPPPAPRIFSEEAIRKHLQEEIGAACEPGRIGERLAIPYRTLGYVPSIRAQCDDGVLSVEIQESSHVISVITFDAGDLTAIGKEAVGKSLPDEKVLYPVPDSAPRALLSGLLQTHTGDLYNVDRYRTDRDALGHLGYLVLFVAGAPAPAGAYPQGAYLIQSVTQMTEDPKQKRHKVNYIGGTASYQPRAGPAAGLIYSRSALWQPLDQLSITPTYNTALGGAITYAAPLLAARVAPHRLYDINVSAYSNFNNNRLIEDDTVDERRTGISTTLGIRPLRFPAPHDLRYEIGVRRELVRFDQDPPGQTGIDLSLLRLGLTHVWRHTYLHPGFTLRTEPTLEVSLEIGNGVPYVRPGLTSFLHSRLRSGFEVDLHLASGGLDRPVPPSEMFSLGGVLTVRGFQEDTHLGRGLVALQNELWIPFVRPLEARPVVGADPSDLAETPFIPTFARHIKAAVFLDGGSIWQSEAGGRESLFGAGVGLRFVVPHEPLVIRIDYGWGLGQAGGDSYPYVSIGYVR